MRILLIFILALPLFAQAECQDLVRVYGTIDLQKKSWTTEDGATPVSWCIPLVNKTHNILLTLSKEGKSFKVGAFQSLHVYWDEVNENRLRGGVREASSVMIQVPLPLWYKGARVKVTNIDTKEQIAEGTL